MKKVLIGIIFVTTGLFGHASEMGKPVKLAADIAVVHGDLDEGISFFKGTWKEALKASDKEDKLIFLDAYAAWCGPCKMMAKQTFTDSKVGEFFNENFINFKMDMEKHAEGPRLSKKFGLRAYPTLFFLDENENVVHQTLGFQDVKSLIAFGKEALKA